MTTTLRGCLALLRLSWREGPARTATAVILMVGNALSLPAAALTIKWLTNAVLADEAVAAVWAGLATAVLAIFALTLDHFAHIALFELADLNLLAMDRDLITLANGSPGLEQHERKEYADKLAVLREEAERLRYGMQALTSAGALSLSMLLTALLLAMLNPLLLLLPLFAVPPLVAGGRAQSMVDRARDASAAADRLARHLFKLSTDPGAAKELRVFGLTSDIRRRHAGQWQASTAARWRAERSAAVVRTAGQLVFAVGYIGAVLLVVSQAAAGQRSVGDVVLAVTLAAQVNQQVAAGLALAQQLQRLAGVFTRFRWLRDFVTANAPAGRLMPPDALTDGIRCDDVSFSYPGTDGTVLRDVSLHLPAGTTVAIVGENGAGKSTLIKLLCGFYQATTGRILVDGMDLSQFSPGRWRDRIAAGFQDFARLELLARETVGVGDLPHVDEDAHVYRALDRGAATEVVEQLPDGLATSLGRSYTDGAELSGGQWQRLALARAMMRDSPLLLVLDEPTASLDAQAEHDLFDRYARRAQVLAQASGAITVLVSHRFSTVRMADLVVVVENGRVTETGDHETLMASGGLYAELFTMQSQAYA